MKRLHPVFNIVKLTPAPIDPIPGRRAPPPPPPELIDGEEEYIVEEILDSRMFRRRLQYLVKWEGYGAEGNSWEYSENVANAPEKVAIFHQLNPAAPHRIRSLTFGSIPFRPIPFTAQASSRCFSRGGVIVRGTPFRPIRTTPDPPAIARDTSATCVNARDANTTRAPIADAAPPPKLVTRVPFPIPYIPPYRRSPDFVRRSPALTRACALARSCPPIHPTAPPDNSRTL